MQTEITELLDAISKEIDLEKYFTKVIFFLSQDFCKKCEIIWPEGQKFFHLKKVGRNNIEKSEYESEPQIQENGYKIISLDVPSFFPHKAFIKYKPKVKLSWKRFSEILNIISCGAEIVIERRKKLADIHNLGIARDNLIKSATEISNLWHKIYEKYSDRKSFLNEIILSIKKIIPVENAGAVILFENEMIETFLDEKDEEFKKLLETKLKNPDLPETSSIYIVEVKGEKISGLVGLKFSQKVEDESLKIITAVFSSIPKIYEFQKTQEEKIKDELQKILEELETGIAILHKLDRKILLSNKKYHQLIENIEKIKEIVMSELNFLSVFGIQGFKKLNLAEKNISIYTKPLEDDKIIVEIQEITKEEESAERMLLKIQLIKKIINLILNISEKELEAEKTQKITSTLLSLLERSIREEPFTPEELKESVLPLQNKFEGKLDMGSTIEKEKSLPKNFLLIFIFIISNLIKISIETREKCRAKMKIGQISDEISVECELQQEGRRSKIKFVEDELDEIIDKLGGSISILKDKNEMKVSISIPKIE
jgi:hypothetical protein